MTEDRRIASIKFFQRCLRDNLTYTGHAHNLDPSRDLNYLEKLELQHEELGFDQTEVNNLDLSIAKFILPRLKFFLEKVDSHPSNLSFDEWKEVIGKMIRAFELMISNNYFAFGSPEITEGLDLFRKYFQKLWL